MTDTIKSQIEWYGLKEKVIEVVSVTGTENQYLWFTHHALLVRLRNRGLKSDVTSLSTVIAQLVKKGYLDRSLIMRGGNRLYIVRRTSKPFKTEKYGTVMKGGSEKVLTGFRLMLEHKKLPKWFRAMMH